MGPEISANSIENYIRYSFQAFAEKYKNIKNIRKMSRNIKFPENLQP